MNSHDFVAQVILPAAETNESTSNGGTTVTGFVIMFFIAVAAFLLIADMVRRVRRVRYGALVDEQLDQEILDRFETELPESSGTDDTFGTESDTRK